MDTYIDVSQDKFEVSNVQAYVAMDHFGVLTPLKDYLATLPENHINRIAFEKAHIFKSDSLVLNEVVTELGLTYDQVRDIFAYARTVPV